MAGDVLVARLLSDPPESEEDLHELLRLADPDEVRAALVSALGGPGLVPDAAAMLAAALDHLELGKEGRRIEVLCLDQSVPRSQRGRLLNLLMAHEPDRAQALVNRLPPEEFTLGFEPLVEDLLMEAVHDIEAMPEVAKTLAESPAEMLGQLGEIIEQVRTRLQLPAALLYGALLRERKLAPAHPALIEALVREGSPSAWTLLEELRGEIADDHVRRLLQGALLRLQTDAITPGARMTPEGYAYVTSCDGDCGYAVFLSFQAAEGLVTASNLTLRTTGEVRDGFIDPALRPAELDEMIQMVEEAGAIEVARTSLGLAAALVEAARAKAPTAEVGPTARAALVQLDRVPPEPLPEVEPADVDANLLEELLARDAYDSWFLDLEPLEELPELPEEGSSPEWRAQALEAIARSSIPAQVLTMARHMMRWHALKGEPRAASVLAGAALELERAPAACALLGWMLDRTLIAYAEQEAEENASDE